MHKYSICMFMLLSSDPPPLQMKPPLTSGSSQPATIDHTCVPSATHAHKENFTLIVGNVRTLCVVDNNSGSKSVTSQRIHMKYKFLFVCLAWTLHTVA